MDDLSSKTCANDLGYHSICIEIKSLEKYFRKKFMQGKIIIKMTPNLHPKLVKTHRVK